MSDTHNTKNSQAKTYINVAYKDRELAKRLGAKWDASVKRWYCPANSTLALIFKWRKPPAETTTVRRLKDAPALAEAQALPLVEDAAKRPAARAATARPVTARNVRVSRPKPARAANGLAPEGNLELFLAS